MTGGIVKVIGLILVIGSVGLLVGYGIFGHIDGEYLPVDMLFSQSEGMIDRGLRSLVGVQEKRQNIMISGAAGATVGLFAGIMLKGKKSAD